MPPKSLDPGAHRRRVFTLPRLLYPVLLAVAALLTLVFGGVGFIRQDPAAANDATLPLFRTFQLFLLNSGDDPHNNWLAAARVSAIVLFLLVSGGVIVRVTRDTVWLPRRLWRRGHYVICGLGRIGVQLLDDLIRDGKARRVVVIEPDESNLWVRHARAEGADVLIGDATRADSLRESRALKAEAVFAVTGDDGANLEIAAELVRMIGHRRARPAGRSGQRRGDLTGPSVHAHVLDLNLAASFQLHSRLMGMDRRCDLHLFNVLRNSATSVITRHLWPHAPRTPEEVSHFAILGFGPMGQTLAVQLAQLAHFSNRKRARFTIADSGIEPLARMFLSRFDRFTAWSEDRLGVSQFSAASDEWNGPQETLPAPLASNDPRAIEYVANAQFRELPANACDELFVARLLDDFQATGVKPAIFICGESGNYSLAMRLRDRLACLDRAGVPIFVWLPRQSALANDVLESMHPFGDCQSTASIGEIRNPPRELFARVIQANYERRAADNKDRAPKPWSAETEAMRESNRQAADHLVFKLAMLGYSLRPRRHDDPQTIAKLPELSVATKELLGEMEHNRWVAERLLAGWRYSPMRNDGRKLHNMLVSNEHLNKEQKRLDVDQIELIPDWVRAAEKEHHCCLDVLKEPRAPTA